MNTHPHNASESARLIQELRQEISKDQAEIRLEDPRLKRLQQEIDKERSILARKELEAGTVSEHLRTLKEGLAQSEREFRELQTEIQKMGLNKH